jgi:hypothetical protein
MRRIWQYGVRIKDVCGEGSYTVMLSDLVKLSARVLIKLFVVKLSSEVAFAVCQLVIASNMLRTCSAIKPSLRYCCRVTWCGT